jgi:hypothetical protein
VLARIESRGDFAATPVGKTETIPPLSPEPDAPHRDQVPRRPGPQAGRPWLHAAAEKLRGAGRGAASGSLELDGELGAITAVYKSIPSRRLVVLGPAGSGKTILALRFVLDWLSAGLMVAIGLTTMRCWGRWVVLSRVWLPLTGKAPWSMIAFLDDAHRRGVLRQAGAVYQFRHARIQAQLAERFERRRRGAGNPADLATQPRAGG